MKAAAAIKTRITYPQSLSLPVSIRQSYETAYQRYQSARAQAIQARGEASALGRQCGLKQFDADRYQAATEADCRYQAALSVQKSAAIPFRAAERVALRYLKSAEQAA